MDASILYLATIGGLVSFISTTLGAVLSLKEWKFPSFIKFKFSIDFALGLMLSAVAFSLVGPAISQHNLLGISILGFIGGGALIYGIKTLIERKQADAGKDHSAQLVLAIALIIHNFPEGLASGAAMAGLHFDAAVSILSSIALQNIPEGLLMVVCLKALGWSDKRAFIGGIVSGVVELSGGILAGFALSWASEALPVILMTAGGAMFTSVVIEIREKGKLKPEFAIGLVSIPLLNSLMF